MAQVHPTPEIMERIYDLLRQTKPFRSWGLPDPDDVVFVVSRSPEYHGEYKCDDGVHEIRISGLRHKTLTTMTLTIAHEMCHMRDHMLGTPWNVEHGRSFKKIAAQVCRAHSYDPANF